MLKIKLVKSLIRSKPGQIGTVKALGLGKVGSVVYQKDSDVVLGMVRKVNHLLQVETVDDSEVSGK